MDRTSVPFDRYMKAKQRLDRLLPTLDPELEVEVDTDVITPADGGAPYTTFLLAFTHASNPRLQWTMELSMDEDYIEHHLEETVKRIYFERVE